MKKHSITALNACIVLASLLLVWQLLVWALSIPNICCRRRGPLLAPRPRVMRRC